MTASGAPLPGESLTLTSSDPGRIGPVTDNGDGTYTATITASKTVGTATITATDTSVSPALSKTIQLKQVTPTVRVALSPTSIAADGHSTTRVTAKVAVGSAPLPGEGVSFSSSDPGQAIGPVTDNGDGTYTATITASRAIGTATITALDNSVSPAAAWTAGLRQVAPGITVSLAPASIAANDRSTTVVTARITASGAPLPGESLTLTSSDPGQAIGPVTDNGDGTYTATITASKAVGTATITATDTSVSPALSKTIQLKQVTPTVRVALSPTSIAADGHSTTRVTAKVAVGSAPLPGEDVSFTSSDPAQTIGPVADNGDGTYTATITASKTVGTATITTEDESVDPAAVWAVTLKQK